MNFNLYPNEKPYKEGKYLCRCIDNKYNVIYRVDEWIMPNRKYDMFHEPGWQGDFGCPFKVNGWCEIIDDEWNKNIITFDGNRVCYINNILFKLSKLVNKKFLYKKLEYGETQTDINSYSYELDVIYFYKHYENDLITTIDIDNIRNIIYDIDIIYKNDDILIYLPKDILFIDNSGNNILKDYYYNGGFENYIKELFKKEVKELENGK
jgi:hypothetical protein